MTTNFLKLTINNQEHISFFKYECNKKEPYIVFLPGYKSDLLGSKAQFLIYLSKQFNFNLLMLEYRGHGNSSGNIYNYTISDWLEDVTLTLNTIIPNNKHILIGSSLGGWLAFLYALNNKSKVDAIIGIAAALDFTNDITLALKNNKNISHKYINEILHYTINNEPEVEISKKLIENGNQNHLLLTKNSINLSIPIYLLHGMLDTVVDYRKSLEITEKVISKEVEIILFKNGDHRLSEELNLNTLKTIILKILNKG